MLHFIFEYLSFYKKFWYNFNRRRKKQFLLLLFLMIVTAFAEVISLSIVYPFITIITTPDKIFNNSIIYNLSDRLGIVTADQLILPITIVFIIMTISVGFLRAFFLALSALLSQVSVADLGIKAYERTLYQPYSIHVTRDSSDIISGIAKKMDLSASVIFSLLTLLSAITMIIVILTFFLFIYPLLALVTGAILILLYVPTLIIVRKTLNNNSVIMAKEQNKVFKALNDGFGGIRDIILNGTQRVYAQAYFESDYALRYAQGKNLFIFTSPRYFFEIVGIVSIVIFAYFLNKQNEGFIVYLPLIGVLALGAQRLLPMVQLCYYSVSQMIGYYVPIKDTIELLDQPIPDETSNETAPPLLFNKYIQLDSIKYRYNSDSSWVLKGLNLSIAKNSRIGIVGETGGGKSTLLDILMGLLLPTEGQITIDGIKIVKDNIRAWQHLIAHVPQDIYLSNNSFYENIAFGISTDKIDKKQVKLAAVQAQLNEFIENLKDGYNTNVGEKGIKLSGGQKQRIGIARALYKNASVLFFDEATSSLDYNTEKNVIEAIEGLSKELTVIIVSHRLTFVENCDVIIQLDQGKVVFQGDYKKLLQYRLDTGNNK